MPLKYLVVVRSDTTIKIVVSAQTVLDDVWQTILDNVVSLL